MGFAETLCFASALIAAVPVPQQSASHTWEEQVKAAWGSESDLRTLVERIRPLAAAPDPSADVTCAWAWSTLGLAELEIAAQRDLSTIEQAAAESRAAKAPCVDDDARTDLELSLADFLIHLGRGASARSVIEQALRSFPNALQNRPTLEVHLAGLHVQSGELDLALADLDRADASLIEGDPIHRFVRGDVEAVRGDAWLALGMPDLAYGCFETSTALAEAELKENGRVEPFVEARMRQAGLALASQDHERVATLLDANVENLAKAEKGGGLYSRLLVRRGLAACELAHEGEGDPVTARTLLETALEDARLEGIDALSAELSLANLALRGNDLPRAEQWISAGLERVSDWSDAGGSEPPPREMALLQARRAALALARQDPIRVLAERRRDVRAALDNVIRAGKSAPIRAGGIGLLHWGSQRYVLDVLMQLEMTLDVSERGRANALQSVIDVEQGGTLVRTVGVGPVTVEDVQRDMLRPGTGVLVYVPSTEGSCVFALDRDSIECGRLAPRFEILRQVHPLWGLISTLPGADVERRDRDVGASTRALATMVFPSCVQKKLEAWSSVIIVGADLLDNLPFECLPIADGRPLGIALATSRMPSLPFGVWLARRADRGRKAGAFDFVLVTQPELTSRVLGSTPGPDRLVLAEGDGQRLSAPFASGRTATLTGSRACQSELLATSARGIEVLEFAAHGKFDWDRTRDGERVAGLVLSSESGGDGVLWCADVQRLLAARLVELISCGSKRGPSRMGDDLGPNLAGAFFASGVETVVASSVEIAQRSSIELSVVFNDRLGRLGATPAEAMRCAREVVARDPRTHDPYYWALLSVDGLADRALFAARPGAEPASPDPRWVWIAVAALGLLVILVGARVRSSWRASLIPRSERSPRG